MQKQPPSPNKKTASPPSRQAVTPLKEEATPASMVVLPADEVRKRAALSPDTSDAADPSSGRTQVHVAPNLLDLITGRTVTPEAQQEVREQHDLNQVIHRMLVVGLIVSTALMLVGLALDFILGREVPTTVPDLNDAINRVLVLRPSGFLAMGLLALIATPILQIVGSIFTFLYNRDWRYAGITCLVLGVVLISLIAGKG